MILAKLRVSPDGGASRAGLAVEEIASLTFEWAYGIQDSNPSQRLRN